MGLNKYIEYTMLNSDLRSDQIIDLCNEAIKYECYSVCVSPTYVMLAKELLKNKPIKVSTVVGFPLGVNTNIVKLMEAKDALEKGADELDVVINTGALRDGKIQYVLNELQAIKKIAVNKIVKAIVETATLTKEEIITATKICVNAGVDFIQIASGYFGSAINFEYIQLIASTADGKLKIKAVGQITSSRLAKKLINKGVIRIGTSQPSKIVKASTKVTLNKKQN